MSILHKLKWRYAVRKFNTEKKVPEEIITELLNSVHLSASALGLQPYEFVVIHNKSLQKELEKYSHNQKQVSEASHLIVFAAKTKISATYIQNYIQQTEKAHKLIAGDFRKMGNFISDIIAKKSDEELLAWSEKQAYLALGTLLIAAADLKVDVCPLELIDIKKYNEILDLEKDNLSACVVAAVGYRSVDDKMQYKRKSRRELSHMIRLKYE